MKTRKLTTELKKEANTTIKEIRTKAKEILKQHQREESLSQSLFQAYDTSSDL
jgi:hypothetical protein